MQSCFKKTSFIEFSKSQIQETIEKKGLLSLEIELTLKCNFRCLYCYTSKDNINFTNEISLNEIYDVILQAKDLSAKKIILLGGEPMLHPNLVDIINFIYKQDMNIELFTNGTGINLDIAKILFNCKVKVVLKMNSLDKNKQDFLSGKKGAFDIAQNAFKNLKKVGYLDKGLMAISTVICKDNIDEILELWQYLRNNKIEPYFEIITPQGNAKKNDWLNIDTKQIHDIFLKVLQIDQEQYGYNWDIQPPLMGHKCLRHQFSCLVNSQGFVMPCVGVNVPVGNIREEKLKNIIKNSEVINELRNYKNTIKGPCKQCKQIDYCYGCRGTAYQLTGDYLASDPICWNNIDKKDQIKVLPFDVTDIIPQKKSMKMIDKLLTISERKAESIVTISKDMLFVNDNGFLNSVVYIEMIAQTIAAMDGFKNIEKSPNKLKGFLLGIKNFEIYKESKAGDILNIHIYKYAGYEEFGIIKGTIYSENELRAKAEIKIWHEK